MVKVMVKVTVMEGTVMPCERSLEPVLLSSLVGDRHPGPG